MHIVILASTACAATDPPAPRAPASVQVPSAHAAVVQDLVGVWVGKGQSPMGELPIALEFKREGNDVRAIFGGGEMYLDFRFHREGDSWLLTEEGKFPGLGVQRHTLVPIGATARWVDREDPTLLDVTLELREPNLVFATKLRGEPHAVFTLARSRGTVSSR
jgi:hypothetical protein